MDLSQWNACCSPPSVTSVFLCTYFLSWSSWTSILVKEKCFSSITMVEFHVICRIYWYCCSLLQATRVSFATFFSWFYPLLSYWSYVFFCVSCYFSTWGFVLIHFCGNDFDIPCTYVFSIRSHIHGSSLAVTLVMYVGSTYSSSSVSFPYFFLGGDPCWHSISFIIVLLLFSGLIFIFCLCTLYILSTCCLCL